MGHDNDDDQKRKPLVTDLSDPVCAFRAPPVGRLELLAAEKSRLDTEIIATSDVIKTTGRRERAVVLNRKLEILKAKRDALK